MELVLLIVTVNFAYSDSDFECIQISEIVLANAIKQAYIALKFYTNSGSYPDARTISGYRLLLAAKSDRSVNGSA